MKRHILAGLLGAALLPAAAWAQDSKETTAKTTTDKTTLNVETATDTSATQAYIGECRAANQALRGYSMLSTVRALLDNQCPNVYGGVWFEGTGVAQKDPTTCDQAWAKLNANADAAKQARTFVTRNCPQMYGGLGWRSGPLQSPPVTVCSKAVNSLVSLGKANQAGNLVKRACRQMFDYKWLVLATGQTNSCETIWNGLTTANATAPAQALITHNCPWLYANGYIVPMSPIVN